MRFAAAENDQIITEKVIQQAATEWAALMVFGSQEERLLSLQCWLPEMRCGQHPWLVLLLLHGRIHWQSGIDDSVLKTGRQLAVLCGRNRRAEWRQDGIQIPPRFVQVYQNAVRANERRFQNSERNECDTCLCTLAALAGLSAWHCCIFNVPPVPHWKGSGQTATTIRGGGYR